MFLQLNGQILYYEKNGEGKPIILLHGNGGDHTMYDELVDVLKDDYTLYCIDSRGHGGSATPPGDEYHYQDMANDVLGFIKNFNIDSPLLVGFSDGAIIALLAALKDEAALGGLILCGANLSPSGIEKKELKQMKKDYKKTKDPKVKLMIEEPNISTGSLKKLTLPVAVCAGEKDCITEKETQKIYKNIENSALYTFKDCDHFSYIVDKADIEPIIREMF